MALLTTKSSRRQKYWQSL